MKGMTRMATMTWRALLLVALLAVASACGARREAPYRLVRAPQPGDVMAVHVYELANGLRVYLTHNAEEPRFYSEIVVRAGSKHDPAETTGLAHYLEHLLFKGTERLGTLDYAAEKPYLDRIVELYEEHFAEQDPERRREIYAEINRVGLLAAALAVPNEFDTVYKAFGAQGVNAHTWREETVYKVDLPKNRLRHWAILESERFARPVFRLFHTELETVYEEKNRAMDNKDRIIFDAVNKLLFKKHPYGQQTTLGDAEHLKRPSLVNIQRFYDTWYVPNNMAIVVSGDIDIDETIRLIAEHFNVWKPRALPDPEVWLEDPIKEVERVTVQYPGEEYVLLAFRTAPRGSRDADALKVLDMILDNQSAGLINLNLNQQQRVRNAGAYPLLDNDYGTQYLWGVPKAGQSLEEVEELLLEQVRLVQAGDFEDWILPAIVTDFRKNQASQLERNAGRVSAIRDSFLAFEEWEEALRAIDRIEAVTREDVVRVANAYFSGGYVSGYRRDGQHEVLPIEKPAIDPLPLDPSRRSEFGAQLLAIPAEPIEPTFVDPQRDFHVVQDGPGRTIYHAPNPLNDLFTLQIIVEKGTDHDNRLALASRLLDLSGTRRLPPDGLKKEWYRIGTEMSVSSSGSETAITLSGLDEYLAPSLALLREVLTEPVAPAGTLDELKKIVLAERDDERKDPQSLARALYIYNRYGEESPYLERLSTDALLAVEESELFALMTGLPAYRHVVSYTGTRSPEQVRALLAEHLPAAASPVEPPPYRRRTVRKVDATQLFFIDQETAQSQVRIESAGADVDERRQVPVLLFNSYFAGGLSGIVYQELREARGLVYFAGALYSTADRLGDQDLMLGALGCQADKTLEATTALLDLMENLPVQPERFARSVESLDSRYRTSRLGFREVIGAVRSWERLGLEPDPRRARHAQLATTTFDEMLGFHRAEIAGKPRLISIVGDSKRIDMEALRALGEFEEIAVERIFVP
jgi:predicted Zn-dependent peptidase